MFLLEIGGSKGIPIKSMLIYFKLSYGSRYAYWVMGLKIGPLNEVRIKIGPLNEVRIFKSK